MPDQHLERGGHVGRVQPDGDQPGVLDDPAHHGHVSSARTQGLPASTATPHDDRIDSGHAFIKQLPTRLSPGRISHLSSHGDPQAGQLEPERLGEASLVLAGVGQEHGGRRSEVVIHDR